MTKAQDIVDNLLSSFAADLGNNDEIVTSCLAGTNTTGVGFDEGEILEAFFEKDGETVMFKAILTLTGDQDPDKPWSGDTFRIEVEGAAVDGPSGWVMDEYRVLSWESNFDDYVERFDE
jgi:hypothetical protein